MPLEATPIQVVKLGEQPPTLESMASARAMATPLPGPVLAAYTSDTIEVAGYSVRKVVAFDYVFWQFTESPIMQQLLEIAKPEGQREEIQSTDEQEWEVVFQFISEPRKLRDLMKKGRQAVADAAFEEINVNLKMEPETVRLILLAVFEQIKRNAETANKYMTEAKEGGQITFFRENRPPA